MLDIFRQTGAILEGHFLPTSGRHSGTYLEKLRVLQYPQQTQRLCRLIADRVRASGVQVVAGLTTGGSIRDVLDAVRQAGGEPVGGGRSRRPNCWRHGLRGPLFACTALKIESYESSQCPLCREGVPLTKTQERCPHGAMISCYVWPHGSGEESGR